MVLVFKLLDAPCSVATVHLYGASISSGYNATSTFALFCWRSNFLESLNKRKKTTL